MPGWSFYAVLFYLLGKGGFIQLAAVHIDKNFVAVDPQHVEAGHIFEIGAAVEFAHITLQKVMQGFTVFSFLLRVKIFGKILEISIAFELNFFRFGSRIGYYTERGELLDGAFRQFPVKIGGTVTVSSKNNHIVFR